MTESLNPDAPKFYFGPLKPDLWLPHRLSGSVQLPDDPFVYRIELETTDELEGYRLVLLEIRADDRITTPQVHKLSLPKILHAFASADPFVVSGTLPESPERAERFALWNDTDWQSWQRRALSEAGATRPTAEVLLWVARVYAWYRAVGGNPARAVSETLAIPERTASRWVARARSEGLLDG